MAVRERLEYDVAVTGAREGERALASVERAIGDLTAEQRANVAASREFAAAQDKARGSILSARRADLDLAAARAKLAKVTGDGKATEEQRARALLAMETAELKAARAAKASGIAHARVTQELHRASSATQEVEQTTTRATRAMHRMGAAGRGAGKATAVGFAGVSKTIGGVRVGLTGVFRGMALGIPVAGALGVGLGALGAMTYKAASNLDLMERKAKTVYGRAFPQVVAWSEKVAARAGMTSREMTGLATSFADMLKPMGFAIPEAAKLSQRFAAMAPVLAEWSAGQFSVADTSEALMGALTGEYDTLQRLGIPISDAIVQEEALRLGLVKSTVDHGKLSLARQRLTLAQEAYNKAVKAHGPTSTEARRAAVALQVAQEGVRKAAAGSTEDISASAKAQAALSLIYKGSTDAQNNYARGAASLAAKQAVASAKLKEVRDTILSQLLPALSSAADWFLDHEDDIIDWAFHAAAGVVTFGERTGLAFADVIEWVGRGMIYTGRFVASMIGGFAMAGKASTALGAILGIGLSPQAKRAGEALDRMAATAGRGMVDAGERAVAMSGTIRREVPQAADVARTKLEQVRRAALNIPNKTVTQLEVEEEQARANIVDIRRRLTDPELTRTRRAKMEADLKRWRAQLAQIQRDKALAARAIVAPVGVKGLPSRVRVTREKDKSGTVTGIIIGTARAGVQGRAAGGPVHGPGTGTSDSIPALVYARGGGVAAPAALSDGEHVLTARDVDNLGGHGGVYRMRQAAASGRLRHAFADGGPVNLGLGGAREQMRSGMQAAAQAGIRAAVLSQIAAAIAAEGGGPYSPGLVGALAFLKAQAGAPYTWAAAGPKAVGYDCSGLHSAGVNVALGRRSPYARLGSTGTMPWSMLAPGPGAYSIGWFTGNPGHMAATVNGVNVESRGGDGVVVGPRARGARDAMFGGRIAHLKGFAAGGAVGGDPSPFGPAHSRRGDPAFDLLSPRGMYTHGRRPHVAMATGGVIREPVVGVGRSGTTYSFAERGPETVTPGAPLTSRDVEEAFYRAMSRAAADGNALAGLLAEMVAGPILEAADAGSRR